MTNEILWQRPRGELSERLIAALVDQGLSLEDAANKASVALDETARKSADSEAWLSASAAHLGLERREISDFMTPTRLRDILAVLGWSQRYLAERLAHPEGVVRGWARGVSYIPSSVAEWLEGLVRPHEEDPMPKGWLKT